VTAEPERTPPSGTGPVVARAVDLLTGRTGADACPAWLEYPLGPVETIAIPAAADLLGPRNKNGKLVANPWDEPAQSTPLADIVEATRLAREYSTPFGEEAP
jgi:hypothetical protein